MAVTIDNVSDKLADWLGTDATRFTVTRRFDLINMVQRQILRVHDLRFAKISDTLAVAAGDRFYDLPANFSRPHVLRYKNSAGSWVFLEQKSYEWAIKKYPDPSASDTTVRGPVAYYAVVGSELQLFPTPEAAITVYQDYYRYLPDLTTGQSNAFTDNAWEVLLYGGLLKASKYLVEDGRIAVWREEYEEALADLIHEHKASETAGRRPISIEPH